MDLRDGLRSELTGVPVELGMRYGTPTIAGGLENLRAAGCDRILCAPLYPQYASSSTGTALEQVYAEAARLWNTPFLEVLPPFHGDARFLDAVAANGKKVLEELQPDHVLFSFHGLPERHCKKSDESGSHCLQAPDCCARIVDANRNCYRAQCFATARDLRERLGLDESSSTITFQSRLGRTPWIKPYTDFVLPELYEAGKRSLFVVCPAFTADNLETLEEVGIRLREQWRELGGSRFALAPCVNASPAYVEALAKWVLAYTND